MEFFFIQSRIPLRIMSTRRSNASKWGSQSTGATGSFFNDSRIAADNGFGPFWKLSTTTEKGEKYSLNSDKNSHSMPMPTENEIWLFSWKKVLTYFKRIWSVDNLIMQHCNTEENERKIDFKNNSMGVVVYSILPAILELRWLIHHETVYQNLCHDHNVRWTCYYRTLCRTMSRKPKMVIINICTWNGIEWGLMTRNTGSPVCFSFWTF